ncbi:MAG: GGDEF domain-containing protein [Candidatus Obscuribacterales bacterium]|nr:GGDEF domain-containing protein [Candidatus Obscuribacterales bacterium]
MPSDEIISDNKFHKRLSEVRNAKSNKTERLQAITQPQRTLYSMPVAERAEKPAEQKDKFFIYDEEIQSIYNFRFAMRQLQLEVRRAEKYGRPLSILVVGFHELQEIRNQYSIMAVESLLQAIGAQLVQYVELGIDIVGRYGGEKFIIVLPEYHGPAATMIAEEIRKNYEYFRFEYRQHKIPLKASIGISCYPQHADNWKELIARGDLACDLLMERGGNAFGFAPS